MDLRICLPYIEGHHQQHENRFSTPSEPHHRKILEAFGISSLQPSQRAVFAKLT